MNDAPDWRQLVLHGHGRTLVEASAGTGKTWTIGALYLRLLLESTRSTEEQSSLGELQQVMPIMYQLYHRCRSQRQLLLQQ